jgi:GLPGLI family protein
VGNRKSPQFIGPLPIAIGSAVLPARLFKTLLVILCVAMSFAVQAQVLLLQGKITFERRENMHKLLDDEIAAEKDPNPWMAEARKMAPKYRTDIFQLSFTPQKSLYQMTTEDEIPFNQRWYRTAYNNMVLTDLTGKRFSTQKGVYEKEYRITDSLPQHKWKLSNEYREIAGKNCRKATTILFDSVFVIAFYTDEIPVSGGPENFQGLPGMILGIVIPRIHYTCFATSIQSVVVPETELQLPPVKRKTEQVNIATFKKTMMDAFKDWGDDAIKVYWRTMF